MTGEGGAAQGAERVQVGVVLPRPADDPGEWLIDAVAFEAAGADALWVEHGAAPALDPLTLTAALAAVTYRSLLVVATVVEPGHARALATVRRLSRGRLALITTPESPATETAGPETAATESPATETAHPEIASPETASPETAAIETAAPGDAAVGAIVRLEDGSYRESGSAGRWVPVGVPVGRVAWREVLRVAGERGDRGVLVPADPRLLDLLRNPEDPGGRHDLQLAQG